MGLLAELIPVITFFIAYQLTDLYIATFITMGVSILQLFASWVIKKPISVERWITASLFVILGGITLISKNSLFIKSKATIGYGVLAATFALAPYRNNMTLLEANLGNTVYLSQESWNQLNKAWIGFFCVMSLLNLIIAFTTSTEVWLYFKLFGVIGLTSTFIAAQLAYLTYFKKFNQSCL